jgi:putative transposase
MPSGLLQRPAFQIRTRPGTEGPALPPIRTRKSPRLKGYDYVGPLAAHIVCVTDFREPFFAEASIAEIGREALYEAASKQEATIHAYSFMPDHAHVLVQLGEGESLEVLVKRFKQLAGYRAKQVSGKQLWQPSYYDHMLRQEEALENVAAYVWQNPVAAGLVEAREAYDFSGPRDALVTSTGDASLYAPPRSFPDFATLGCISDRVPNSEAS